jgi:hypothetical protein
MLIKLNLIIKQDGEQQEAVKISVKNIIPSIKSLPGNYKRSLYCSYSQLSFMNLVKHNFCL